MVIWSPDDQEMFPTAYGDDGKLFTADDPISPIPAGWTVVNLDKRPFELIRQRTVEVPILEGLAANNDLSNLSYTQAFDALVNDLKVRYTFTEYKHIDWDALVKEIRPLVEKAERDKDKDAFNIAMMRFAAKFKDGHLSVDTNDQCVTQQTEGGVGMVLGQTDDGKVIVRAVSTRCQPPMLESRPERRSCNGTVSPSSRPSPASNCCLRRSPAHMQSA